MGMLVRYGNYSHATGEVGFNIERDYVLDAAKRPVLLNESWTLNGRLYTRNGDTKSTDSAIAALEAAYSIPKQELALLHADGSPTINRIRPSECLEGPRITRPISYPNGKGPYFALWVDFTVTLSCTRAVGSAPIYMSFEESLTFEGGGAQRGIIEVLRGSPQVQLCRRKTIYKATQRGSAVGFYASPSVPSPLFPEALMRDPSAYPVTYGPRQRIGDFGFGYPVSWEYQFESAQPLTGTPNYY